MTTTNTPSPRLPRTPRNPVPLISPTLGRFDDPEPSDAATPPVHVGVSGGEDFPDVGATPASGVPGVPASTRTGAVDTDALANDVNSAHREGLKMARKAVQYARRAREMLLRARDSVRHGGFQRSFQSHCCLSYAVGVAYMRIAARWERVAEKAGQNLERVPDLTLRGALELIADHSPRSPAPTAGPAEPDVAPDSDEPGQASGDAHDSAAFSVRPRPAPTRLPRPAATRAGPAEADDDLATEPVAAPEADTEADGYGFVPPALRSARQRPERLTRVRPGGFPWPGLRAGPAAEAMDAFRDPIQSALEVLITGFSPARIDVRTRNHAWESSAEYRSALVRLLQTGGPSELADCGFCHGDGTDGGRPCQACRGTRTMVVK